jgi:hypothetical protein
MSRLATLLVLAFVVSAPAFSAIEPADQRLAARLTLRLDDFSSGWTVSAKRSRTTRKLDCGTAPKIQSALTGFTDSAIFVRVGERYGDQVFSATRVFKSQPLAARWFNWSGGGKDGQCYLAKFGAYVRQEGYRVFGLGNSRQSFSPSCSDCAPFKLRARALRIAYAKPGNHPVKYFTTQVVVLYDRAVIVFYFDAFQSRFCCTDERLVAAVLKRAPK